LVLYNSEGIVIDAEVMAQSVGLIYTGIFKSVSTNSSEALADEASRHSLPDPEPVLILAQYVIVTDVAA